MPKATAKYTVAQVKVMLATDDRWIYRGLKVIFDAQTADEQADGFTKMDNGVGFTGADAPILSGLAKHLIAKGWLSPKQMDICRKRMPKYAAQLLRAGKQNGQQS